MISLYEGDRSGVGKVTRSDQYQRNEVTGQYIERIKLINPSLVVKKRGNVLILSS